MGFNKSLDAALSTIFEARTPLQRATSPMRTTVRKTLEAIQNEVYKHDIGIQYLITDKLYNISPHPNKLSKVRALNQRVKIDGLPTTLDDMINLLGEYVELADNQAILMSELNKVGSVAMALNTAPKKLSPEAQATDDLATAMDMIDDFLGDLDATLPPEIDRQFDFTAMPASATDSIRYDHSLHMVVNDVANGDLHGIRPHIKLGGAISYFSIYVNDQDFKEWARAIDKFLRSIEYERLPQ